MPGHRQRAHDLSFKQLFARPELVADLLRSYGDRHITKRLDLGTLERCNGSYVSPDLRERRTDMIWRVRTRDQEWIYVYLLLEFQSRVDRFMAVRVLNYISLMWQDLIDQKKLLEDGRLPPVLPLVLYNGSGTWTAPCSLRQLISPALPLLNPLQPDCSFLLLDAHRLPTAAGLRARSLSAAIMALEQSRDDNERERIVMTINSWLRDRPEVGEAMASWIVEALAHSGLMERPAGDRLKLNKVESMLHVTLRRQAAAARAAARAEGRAEGEAAMMRLIHQLVKGGKLSVADARTQVRGLQRDKILPRQSARRFLAQLG